MLQTVLQVLEATINFEPMGVLCILRSQYIIGAGHNKSFAIVININVILLMTNAVNNLQFLP